MKKFIIATAMLGMAATSLTAPATAAPVKANIEIGQMSDVVKVGQRHGVHKGHHRYQERILNPRRIARKLHRKGFRDIRNIRFRNGVYKVRAIGRRGPVRLTVSASNGRVLHRQRLGHRRHYNNPGYWNGGHRGGFSWSFTVR